MEEYQKTIENIRGKIIPKRDLQGRIRNEKIFFYDKIDDDDLFNKYNDFVKITEEKKILFKELKFLKDFNFYFTDFDRIDAFGGIQTSNGLPIIAISNTLFERIYTYCKEIDKKINSSMVGEGIDVNGIFGIPLSDFLFSIATTCLFYHESAHVIQDESILGVLATEDSIDGQQINTVAGASVQTEVEVTSKDQDVEIARGLQSDNTAHVDKIDFKEESHIDELDADQFAARMVCKDVLTYFGIKLPEEKRTPENLADLMAMALLGITILFHILSEELTVEFYLKKGTHPHHAIRIKNAIEVCELVVSQFDEEQKKDEIKLPGEPKRFQNVTFTLNVDRMLTLYVKVIVHILKSHERFLDHLFMKSKPGDIQEYLDEMVNKTLTKTYPLMVRGIG